MNNNNEKIIEKEEIVEAKETNEEVVDEVVENVSEESKEVVNENIEEAETLDAEIKQVKEENTIISQVKKILGYIGYGILAILIILVGWMAIQKFVLKDPTPSLFGYSAYYVSTGSMESEIHEGAIVVVKETNDYKAGEIITYLKDGDKVPTTHRIIFVRDGYYITKGDANNTFDTTEVYEHEVVGEVVHVFNEVGIFVNWVKDGGGFIYILVIAIVLGAGIYILKQD